jgi:hypothetical protein
MKALSAIAVALVLATFIGCKRPQKNAAPADTATAPAAAPTAPATPVDTASTTDPATTPSSIPSVAGDAIPELPEYPGATRVAFSMAPKVGFRKSVEAEYLTNDQFAQVKAFYDKAITDGGWRVIRQKAKFGEHEWELAKGTSLAEIEVDTERTGGVSVKLERKDR